MPSGNRDVEHAETLHREALVVDSHSGLIVDVVRRRVVGERAVMRNVHLPRLREGGVDVVGLKFSGDTIFAPVYKTDRHLNVALWNLEVIYQEVDESAGEMIIATTVEEMRQAKQKGQIALLLSVEGIRPIEDRLEFLSLFYRLGLRRVGLTWNFRNRVADGCGEEQTGGGITRFGIEVLAQIERLGMVLDVAHISESSFWSALEHHHGPFIVSHANARALCDHPRNLTDEQIKAVAARGGIVGVAFIGIFISKDEPTIGKLVDHVDHIVELVGVDHIGLGSDYTDDHFDLTGAGLSAYPDLYPRTFEDVQEKYPPNLSTYAETGNLTVELVRRGYSDGDVRKILGENYLRVFDQVFHPGD